jgi:hypothetical protein
LKKIHRACKEDVRDITKKKFIVKKKVYVWKEYLGFIVGKRQVKTDSRKVKTVSK